jgi:hypothetical protein
MWAMYAMFVVGLRGGDGGTLLASPPFVYACVVAIREYAGAAVPSFLSHL